MSVWGESSNRESPLSGAQGPPIGEWTGPSYRELKQGRQVSIAAGLISIGISLAVNLSSNDPTTAGYVTGAIPPVVVFIAERMWHLIAPPAGLGRWWLRALLGVAGVGGFAISYSHLFDYFKEDAGNPTWVAVIGAGLVDVMALASVTGVVITNRQKEELDEFNRKVEALLEQEKSRGSVVSESKSQAPAAIADITSEAAAVEELPRDPNGTAGSVSVGSTSQVEQVEDPEIVARRESLGVVVGCTPGQRRAKISELFAASESSELDEFVDLEELAGLFGVSRKTIQRDKSSLNAEEPERRPSLVS